MFLTIRQKIAALILLASLAVGGILLFLQREVFKVQEYPLVPAADSIMVHVCGAVKKPGVIKTTPGKRKYELIELAGGALPEADLRMINLAAYALDGEQIHLPTKAEVARKGLSPRKSSSRKKLLKPPAKRPKAGQAASLTKLTINWPRNLNKITKAELVAIPGIGPVLAERILEYRRQNGAFGSYADLAQVSGIGASKLAKWRIYLEVK